MDGETTEKSDRDRAQASWGPRARAYFELTQRWLLFERIASRLLAASDEGPLLDVGAGSGLLAALALARAPRREVVLLEPVAEMLSLALERPWPRQPAVLTCAAEELVAAPERFAAALSNATFHLVDEERALPRIAQALQPGGVLAFNLWWHSFDETKSDVPEGLAREPLREALREHGLAQTRLPDGASPRVRKRADYARIGAVCGLLLEQVSVDHDSVSRSFFVEFAAMSEGLLSTLDPVQRDAIFRRAGELAQDQVIVPSVRVVLRKRDA